LLAEGSKHIGLIALQFVTGDLTGHQVDEALTRPAAAGLLDRRRRHQATTRARHSPKPIGA